MRESQADDTEVYSRCTDFSELPLLLEINFTAGMEQLGWNSFNLILTRQILSGQDQLK
jgi:hypothetical protein